MRFYNVKRSKKNIYLFMEYCKGNIKRIFKLLSRKI